MLKIMVDDSFLKALIFEDHPKHTIASKMAEAIDDTEYLFIPCYVLNHVFDDIGNNPSQESKKFFDNICCSTRNIRLMSRESQKLAYEIFESHPPLSYEESFTVALMQINDMRHIISFNEKYDNVKEIKRLYDVDEYSMKRLNYIIYE